jgi:C1A family cysteine protease
MNSQAGLGRVHKPDERDHNYLMPRTTAEAEARTSRYWISPGEALDQRDTSECVIHSMDKYLTSYPVKNVGFGTPQERTRIYKEVQKVDEWPGEDYDGTSVRASFKWMQSQGMVKEYRWAFAIEPVVTHLLTVGPVCFGTDWYMDMFMPDRHGYLTPTGSLAGGHAYLAIGCNRLKKNPDGTLGAIQFINSWGPRWSNNGRFWLSFSDADKLIKDNGEACTATEIRKAK